ncbi:MAG TPA: hypothetical protein VHE30_22360 [Polyangiaceae bacterium]|nr:hypothetical protein [Polyangiaceae bacterium]
MAFEPKFINLGKSRPIGAHAGERVRDGRDLETNALARGDGVERLSHFFDHRRHVHRFRGKSDAARLDA